MLIIIFHLFIKKKHIVNDFKINQILYHAFEIFIAKNK